MSPQEMEELQAMGGKKDGVGAATKIAQEVAMGLKQLSEMLAGSQGATDQDKQQMDQIMSMFVDLVEKKLAGQAPGQDPEAEAPLKEMPMQQGMNGVPMGPQTKN